MNLRTASACLFLLAAAGLASLGIEHRSQLTLPAPTGPLPVGRTLYDWVGEKIFDGLGPAPPTKREVLVWIWYPAAAQPGAAADDYLPAAVRVPAPAGSWPWLLKPHSWLFELLDRDPSKVHGHSLRAAQLSLAERSYPVLLLRAGATSPVIDYSTLAEDLASHGYIVAGLDAPYRTDRVVFPDGRQFERLPENNPELFTGAELTRVAGRLLTAWTRDIAFVLDRLQALNASDPSGRFTGRLDLNRVGAFGHSFGGAQAAQFCHDDARCKAGIDIDGAPSGSVIREGMPKPFLFLLSEGDFFSTDAEVHQVMAGIQSIYDRLPPDSRLRLRIRGANHFLFKDDVALLKSHLVLRVLRLLHIIRIEGARQLAITAYCVRSFFDPYLKGGEPSRLKAGDSRYPEIQILQP
jgi:dienelactone hydrolase